MDNHERSARGVTAQREGREVRAALERLRTWYPDDEGLGDDLGTTKNWIRKVSNKDAAVGDDLAQEICDLHDRIRDQVVAADKAAITLVQTMNWIEDEILTPEQLHVIEERWTRTKRQVQALTDDLT